MKRSSTKDSSSSWPKSSLGASRAQKQQTAKTSGEWPIMRRECCQPMSTINNPVVTKLHAINCYYLIMRIVESSATYYHIIKSSMHIHVQ